MSFYKKYFIIISIFFYSTTLVFASTEGDKDPREQTPHLAISPEEDELYSPSPKHTEFPEFPRTAGDSFKPDKSQPVRYIAIKAENTPPRATIIKDKDCIAALLPNTAWHEEQIRRLQAVSATNKTKNFATYRLSVHEHKGELAEYTCDDIFVSGAQDDTKQELTAHFPKDTFINISDFVSGDLKIELRKLMIAFFDLEVGLRSEVIENIMELFRETTPIQVQIGNSPAAEFKQSDEHIKKFREGISYADVMCERTYHPGFILKSSHDEGVRFNPSLFKVFKDGECFYNFSDSEQALRLSILDKNDSWKLDRKFGKISCIQAILTSETLKQFVESLGDQEKKIKRLKQEEHDTSKQKDALMKKKHDMEKALEKDRSDLESLLQPSRDQLMEKLQPSLTQLMAALGIASEGSDKTAIYTAMQEQIKCALACPEEKKKLTQREREMRINGIEKKIPEKELLVRKLAAEIATIVQKLQEIESTKRRFESDLDLAKNNPMIHNLIDEMLGNFMIRLDLCSRNDMCRNCQTTYCYEIDRKRLLQQKIFTFILKSVDPGVSETKLLRDFFIRLFITDEGKDFNTNGFLKSPRLELLISSFQEYDT